MISNITRKSTAETAAATIREAILRGELKSGEKLKETDLCEKLNISRTPLREAFRILQTQNLVQYTTYSGVCVIELSRRYITEMWQIKSILEPAVSALAAQNADQEDLEAIERTIRIEGGVESITPTTFAPMDNNFHIAIARASHNFELSKMVTGLYENTLLPRSKSVLVTRDVKSAYQEHHKIFQAIKDGDIEAARVFTLEHLEASEKAILYHLDHIDL